MSVMVIDWEALNRLDAEADALIQGGNWTQERFEALWAQGLSVTAGREDLLDFLREAAEPSWLPENQRRSAGVARVPRRVTEAIYRLKDGWQPRVVLVRSTSFVWDGELLPSAVADLEDTVEGLQIEASCGRDDEPLLERELHHAPGTLIENSLRLTFPDDWIVDAENAALHSVQSSWNEHQRSVQFKLRADTWHARRTQDAPELWIASVLTPMEIRRGNLRVNKGDIVAAGDHQAPTRSGSLGHLRLRGAYDYYLIGFGGSDARAQYMILDPGPGGAIDRELLHRDLLALQFVLGQHLSLGVLYGMSGPNITALIGSYGRPQLVRYNPGPAIPEGMEGERWIEPFFLKLGQALRNEDSSKLAVAVENYLDSASGTIDRQTSVLIEAITGLCSRLLEERGELRLVEPFERWSDWVVKHGPELNALTGAGRADELRRNLEQAVRLMPRQRIEHALEKLGILLPPEILDEIELYRDRLTNFGALTPDIGRSKEELRREIDLNTRLRTLLVALTAASVGYRGPIRSSLGDPEPPSWWPADPGEKPGRAYVAVNAPRGINLPVLGEGEILLLLERRYHEPVVLALLEAARLPPSRVRTVIIEGRERMKRVVNFVSAAGIQVAVLMATKVRNVPTAIEALRREFAAGESVSILGAVPDVEAWLLADDELLKRCAKHDADLLRTVQDLPPPDEIDDPFRLAHLLLGPMDAWDVARTMDVYRASARSPSLRHFLSSVGDALGVPLDLPAESAARTLNREVIAGLIREMMPSDTIAWRTSDGHTYTAEDISREVETGTEAGQQYARDVLRVAIDFVRRQARARKTA